MGNVSIGGMADGGKRAKMPILANLHLHTSGFLRVSSWSSWCAL